MKQETATGEGDGLVAVNTKLVHNRRSPFMRGVFQDLRLGGQFTKVVFPLFEVTKPRGHIQRPLALSNHLHLRVIHW